MSSEFLGFSGRWQAALWGLALAAVLAGWGVSVYFFEGVPRSEDEVAYVFQAKVFAMGRLAVETPPNAGAFWTPFVLDYRGWRFSKYPPGWPLLLALGYLTRVPWLVNALLGAGILVLIAQLGRNLYTPATGLLAAVLGLTTPVFLAMSGSLLSHNASLFWTTLFLWACFKGIEQSLRGNRDENSNSQARRHLSSFRLHPSSLRRWLYGVAAGLSLGMLFLTRPFAALGVGGPLLGYLGWLALKAGKQNRARFVSLISLLLSAGLLAALYFLYWRAIGGLWGFNAYTLVWPYDRPGFGAGIGAAGYYDFTQAKNNLLFNVAALAKNAFGWPFWLNLIFLPLPFLLQKPRREDWLLLSLLPGLTAVYFFYWQYGGHDAGFPRYYYDALPALWLLTARGLNLLAEKMQFSRFFGRFSWLPWLLLLALVFSNLVGYAPRALGAYKNKYGISAAPLKAVERAGLSKALAFVPYQTWVDFAVPFAANSPTLDGPVVFAITEGTARDMRVIRQFPGRSYWILAGDRALPLIPDKAQ